MLPTGPADPSLTAQLIAIDAIANVVVDHLRDEQTTRRLRDDPSDPVLVQIDGPGVSQFLGKLAKKLDPTIVGAAASSSRTEAREQSDDAVASSSLTDAREQGDAVASSPPADAHDDTHRAWSAVRFDAWQYQRVAPPWWWLITALDKQLRSRFRRQSRRLWVRRRVQDVGHRLLIFLLDLLWVLPGVAIFLVGWVIADVGMAAYVKWAATVVGGLTALGAFGSSLLNALRRHLLTESPRGADAMLRNTDPMADLLHRYEYLVRSAKTPIIVLIDNLDRCRADYVVEMLEGIQTLLRIPPAAREQARTNARHHQRAVPWLGARADDVPEVLQRTPTVVKTRSATTEKAPTRGGRSGAALPLVAFVVAADTAWLCDSYLNVYGEFAKSGGQPGRPFGQSFLDKIFDVQLRLPTVPAAMAPRDPRGDADAASMRGCANHFSRCDSELEVRAELRRGELRAAGASPAGARDDTDADDAPGGRDAPVPAPRFELRMHAVVRLGEIELRSERRQCDDTVRELAELVAAADLGPIVSKQIEAAYCVQRTSQLLGGHAVDHDPLAIRRLGLWTMLMLRWPLLGERLVAFPQELESLRDGKAPGGVDDALTPVFGDRAAVRLAVGLDDVQITPGDIRRFTLPVEDLQAEGGHDDDEPAAAEHGRATTARAGR